MSRDPVDRVLEHNMNATPKPHDPIFNPYPQALPLITTYQPHQEVDDFKPATGDGR